MNSLGEALKNERKKRDITLEEISSKTNISFNTLTSLETEKIGDIPGKFYFINYLRSYLDVLEADTDTFLETHKDSIDALYDRTHELTPDPYCHKLKYSRFKKRNFFVSVLVTVIVFVSAGYLLYTTKEHTLRGWSLQTVDVILPETGIDFTTLAPRESFSKDYSPVNLSIKFDKSCWTQIKRDETKLVESTVKEGESFQFKGYRFSIYLGNPAAVTFLLNGREVSYLKTLARPERMNITPATIKEIFEK